MNTHVMKPERADIAPAADRATDMMSMIYRLATEDSVPVEKLEALLAMKERIDAGARALAKEDEREAAKRAFYDAMALAQAEIPNVLKNKHNSQTRSRYADLAAIYDVAKPIITKYGFSLIYSPCRSEKPDHYGVRYRLSHSAGHVLEDTADIPSSAKGAKGNDVMTPTHAFGSANSYGRRYLICMLFDIATEDDDGNAAGGRGVVVDNGPAVRSVAGNLMERIASATDVEEIRKLKPEIAKLPPGEERTRVVSAAANRINMLEAPDAAD